MTRKKRICKEHRDVILWVSSFMERKFNIILLNTEWSQSYEFWKKWIVIFDYLNFCRLVQRGDTLVNISPLQSSDRTLGAHGLRWSKKKPELTSYCWKIKYIPTYVLVLSEKNLRISWILIYKNRRNIHRDRLERERNVLEKSPPLAQQHMMGKDLTRWVLFPEEQGVSALHQAPQSLGFTPKRWACKSPGLKINKADIQESQSDIENWDSSLRGLLCSFFPPRPRKRTVV